MSAALVGYYASTRYFGSLKSTTQRVRRGILEHFRDEHGDRPIADMPSKFISLTLDRLGPGAARNWLKSIRHLMQYAVSVGLCVTDPTQGVRLPNAKTIEHRAWSDAEVAAYEAKHPIGSKARLAFGLGYYTAQRRSDAIRIGRQHINNGYIQVRQEKTGVLLDIPYAPSFANHH